MGQRIGGPLHEPGEDRRVAAPAGGRGGRVPGPHARPQGDRQDQVGRRRHPVGRPSAPVGAHPRNVPPGGPGTTPRRSGSSTTGCPDLGYRAFSPGTLGTHVGPATVEEAPHVHYRTGATEPGCRPVRRVGPAAGRPPFPRRRPRVPAVGHGLEAGSRASTACGPWPSCSSWGSTSGSGGSRAGFFSLDIFYVLSGYLITGLLLGECATAGRIRLGGLLAPAGPPAAAGPGAWCWWW